MIDLLLNIGNLVCMIGTILMIKDVIKNRNILKGYSIVGSFLTFIACSLFFVSFLRLNLIISYVSSFVTVSFWFFVFIYSLKIWMKKK